MFTPAFVPKPFFNRNDYQRVTDLRVSAPTGRHEAAVTEDAGRGGADETAARRRAAPGWVGGGGAG